MISVCNAFSLRKPVAYIWIWIMEYIICFISLQN
jgi:hypothetical protein